MAINKTVNKSTKTHGAMRNCMEYVLRESKINSSLVYVSGPFDAEEITYDTVYRSFLGGEETLEQRLRQNVCPQYYFMA